ncbi:MAG: LTA synthase family protein [Leptospiraceae bacterium]|nr:LTA synthase family protein [Leptospiraceae bacterium]MDW7976751.1 LTA synthase family protein [Leptospiraceae bacterium]
MSDLLLMHEAVFFSESILQNFSEEVLTFFVSFVLVSLAIAKVFHHVHVFLPRLRLIILIVLSSFFFFLNYQNTKSEFRWDPVIQLYQKGFLQYLIFEVLNYSDYFFFYSENDVHKVIQNNKIFDQNSQNEKVPFTPNVILVLNESFWNPKKAKLLSLKNDPIKEIELSKKAFEGELIVPNVGGGTANTEFEVLTGLRLNLLPEGISPYTGFINQYLYALPFVLKERGYKSIAVHPNFGWFYHRIDVYHFLGFDIFFPLESLPFIPNYYEGVILDDKAYDFVVSLLEKEHQPLFAFLITIQNHFPYPITNVPTDMLDGIKLPQDYFIDEYEQKLFFQHLFFLRRSNLDLIQFLNKLQNQKEPVIVISFGDHLPPFSKEFYQKIGLTDNYLDLRKTPLYIWTNFNFDYSFPKNELYAYELYYLILDILNIQNFQTQMYKGLNDKKAWKLYQYDVLFGKQIFYQKFLDKPLNNSHYQIGWIPHVERIECSNFSKFQVCILVGKNFTPFMKLQIGKKTYYPEFIDESHLIFFHHQNEEIAQIKKSLSITNDRDQDLNSSEVENIPIEYLSPSCMITSQLHEIPFTILSQNRDYYLIKIPIRLNGNEVFLTKGKIILPRIRSLTDKDFQIQYKKKKLSDTYYIHDQNIYLALPNIYKKRNLHLSEVLRFLQEREYALHQLSHDCLKNQNYDISFYTNIK